MSGSSRLRAPASAQAIDCCLPGLGYRLKYMVGCILQLTLLSAPHDALLTQNVGIWEFRFRVLLPAYGRVAGEEHGLSLLISTQARSSVGSKAV